MSRQVNLPWRTDYVSLTDAELSVLVVSPAEKGAVLQALFRHLAKIKLEFGARLLIWYTQSVLHKFVACLTKHGSRNAAKFDDIDGFFIAILAHPVSERRWVPVTKRFSVGFLESDEVAERCLKLHNVFQVGHLDLAFQDFGPKPIFVIDQAQSTTLRQ